MAVQTQHPGLKPAVTGLICDCGALAQVPNQGSNYPTLGGLHRSLHSDMVVPHTLSPMSGSLNAAMMVTDGWHWPVWPFHPLASGRKVGGASRACLRRVFGPQKRPKIIGQERGHARFFFGCGLFFGRWWRVLAGGLRRVEGLSKACFWPSKNGPNHRKGEGACPIFFWCTRFFAHFPPYTSSWCALGILMPYGEDC